MMKNLLLQQSEEYIDYNSLRNIKTNFIVYRQFTVLETFCIFQQLRMIDNLVGVTRPLANIYK